MQIVDAAERYKKEGFEGAVKINKEEIGKAEEIFHLVLKEGERSDGKRARIVTNSSGTYVLIQFGDNEDFQQDLPLLGLEGHIFNYVGMYYPFG